MNKLIYLLLLFPVVVYAQSDPGMPPHRQMNMEQMQKAVACMEGLDRSAFEELDQIGQKIKAEIGSLCKSGKRDEAQDRAMAFAKEMMNRPEMKKMQECGKLAAGMMPKMPYETLQEMGKDRHVCDDFQ
ncbi:MAG: hypothetical protein NPIRA05_09700 [Nitrospirales bacterium]|nr:MAG: hypothetical protein NPIRA05_09700 [Nitrospirales bacterium]